MEIGTVIVVALITYLIAGSGDAATIQPQRLRQKEACELVGDEPTNSGKAYSIKGTFMRDFEHRAVLEPKGCVDAFLAKIDGKAFAKLTRYHEAFVKKCKSALMNDVFSGEFTGIFVSDKISHMVTFQGRSVPINYSYFNIEGFESFNIDESSIACGKQVSN